MPGGGGACLADASALSLAGRGGVGGFDVPVFGMCTLRYRGCFKMSQRESVEFAGSKKGFVDRNG